MKKTILIICAILLFALPFSSLAGAAGFAPAAIASEHEPLRVVPCPCFNEGGLLPGYDYWTEVQTEWSNAHGHYHEHGFEFRQPIERCNSCHYVIARGEAVCVRETYSCGRS